MQIEYKNNKIKKKLESSLAIKKAYGAMAIRVSQRMEQLKAAPTLQDLISIKAANCHVLTGDRKGEWAVDLSGNYRLIFEIHHNPVPVKDDGSVNTILVTDICILETTDYH